MKKPNKPFFSKEALPALQKTLYKVKHIHQKVLGIATGRQSYVNGNPIPIALYLLRSIPSWKF